MSMPISRIASTAQGWTSPVGSMPALYASKRSPPRWRNNPSAIWLLAEFWVHRNSTFCFFFSRTMVLLSPCPLRVSMLLLEALAFHLPSADPRTHRGVRFLRYPPPYVPDRTPPVRTRRGRSPRRPRPAHTPLASRRLWACR